MSGNRKQETLGDMIRAIPQLSDHQDANELVGPSFELLHENLDLRLNQLSEKVKDEFQKIIIVLSGSVVLFGNKMVMIAEIQPHQYRLFAAETTFTTIKPEFITDPVLREVLDVLKKEDLYPLISFVHPFDSPSARKAFLWVSLE